MRQLQESSIVPPKSSCNTANDQMLRLQDSNFSGMMRKGRIIRLHENQFQRKQTWLDLAKTYGKAHGKVIKIVSAK